MCSVGTETSKIEIRYENLSVEGNAFVGHRALPSLYNATFNSIQVPTFFAILLTTYYYIYQLVTFQNFIIEHTAIIWAHSFKKAKCEHP